MSDSISNVETGESILSNSLLGLDAGSRWLAVQAVRGVEVAKGFLEVTGQGFAPIEVLAIVTYDIGAGYHDGGALGAVGGFSKGLFVSAFTLGGATAGGAAGNFLFGPYFGTVPGEISGTLLGERVGNATWNQLGNAWQNVNADTAQRGPATLYYVNSAGNFVSEQSYMLGLDTSGNWLMQTERRIYSPDGSLLKREDLRTNVTDSTSTLNQIRAIASDPRYAAANKFFAQQHGSSLPLTGFNKCFPAGTMVRGADGAELRIEDVKIGNLVSAFDARQFRGRSGLMGGQVVRLFINITGLR